jgi:hypothetical protein
MAAVPPGPSQTDNAPETKITFMEAPQIPGGARAVKEEGGINGTLNENIATTVKRDFMNIWEKIRIVLSPKAGKENILKEWDLWGPLLLCLLLATNLSVASESSDEAAAVFTLVFVLVWCGSAVVTVNSKLLGGTISFFQSVCVLGYCIFPLVVASYLCMLMMPSWMFVFRLLCVIFALYWAVYASLGFLSDCVSASRRVLAVYPIFLFYSFMSWVILFLMVGS